MTEHANPKKKLFKAAALLVSVGVAAGLSFGFAEALSDSLQWARLSEQAVVSPTMVARDLAKAKRIADFTLTDRNGNHVSLSAFAGVDVILVNLWSTGCPGCERELPSLAEMDRRLAGHGNIALLTITIDDSWDDVAHLFPNGTDLRILFDPEKQVVENMFGTTRFPETFILDKQRRVRARFDGERRWHTREMLQYIARFANQ